MGLSHVKGHLTGPTGRAEEVEFLVDTEATLTVVPRSLAEKLELKPARSQPCFIAPDGPPLLGAVALESLFLAVDPVGKRLIPVDGFIG